MAASKKPVPRTNRPPGGGLRRPVADAAANEMAANAAILRNPQFRDLVRERTAFGWTLSIVMLVVYLSFIFAVAFAHETMATKLFGTEISLGILLGFAVIVFAFLLTGVYVARANSRFDSLTRALLGRSGL